MNFKFVAGIGSRKTPEPVLELMEAFGAELATCGYILRSGACRGPDQAFERGCDSVGGDKRIYVPWKGYEGVYSEDLPRIQIGYTNEALEIAKKYHPNWDALSSGGQTLMARNVHIILGKDLKTSAAFVLCWTQNGSGSGGTGQGIRIARDYMIPVYDMGHDPHGLISEATRKVTMAEKREFVRRLVESKFEPF